MVDEAPPLDSLDELTPLVYDELRRIARRYLRRGSPAASVQTTDLVHEAYLRLQKQDYVRWQNRAHVMGVAAKMMRRILVDRARRRSADKRGAGAIVLSLEQAPDMPAPGGGVDVLSLDRALERLTHMDARQGRIVELRVFGGQSVDEVSDIIGVSPATVKREWRSARAWLLRELIQFRQHPST